MNYKQIIEDFSPNNEITENIVEAVNNIINNLNTGKIRVANKVNDNWIINEYVKKSILLFFKIKKDNQLSHPPFTWNDRIPLKQEIHNFRSIPGAIIRHGAFVDKSSIIMPSFINIGAYIAKGAMIDSMTTIGSCAQIGEQTHISANVCIGGVLEPINAKPVIIEDNCFIGANSSITEGILIEKDSIISSGVHITNSTKIIDSETKQISYGVIKSGSVVIPGTYKTSSNIYINAAIVIKKVDSKTRAKTSINELLRI